METFGSVRTDMSPATLVAVRARHTIFEPVTWRLLCVVRKRDQLFGSKDVVVRVLADPRPLRTGHQIELVARRGVLLMEGQRRVNGIPGRTMRGFRTNQPPVRSHRSIVGSGGQWRQLLYPSWEPLRKKKSVDCELWQRKDTRSVSIRVGRAGCWLKNDDFAEGLVLL
jgi:hypothetical protein